MTRTFQPRRGRIPKRKYMSSRSLGIDKLQEGLTSGGDGVLADRVIAGRKSVQG